MVALWGIQRAGKMASKQVARMVLQSAVLKDIAKVGEMVAVMAGQTEGILVVEMV